MTYTVHGIIIAKREWREYDRIFTLYTKEHGKVCVLAQGTRKLLSKLAGNLELLHRARFILAKGKMFDRVTAVDEPVLYERIKHDLEKLALVLFCFDFFDYCVKEGERDEGLFDILFSLIERIQISTPSQAVVITKSFILKVISHLGHGIDAPKELTCILQIIQKKSLLDIPCINFSEKIELLIEELLEEHARPKQKSRVFFDLLVKKHENSSLV